MSFLGKLVKKVGKVVKKAVPILNVVAGFTPLGGVAKLASGGLKTISKLKSAGTNVKRLAMGGEAPQAEKATMLAVTQGGAIQGTTAKRKAAPKAAPKKKAPAKKKATEPSQAEWKRVYAAYQSAGEPGSWNEFATNYLSQR